MFLSRKLSGSRLMLVVGITSSMLCSGALYAKREMTQDAQKPMALVDSKALNSDAIELQTLLKAQGPFQATFQQTVTDSNGKVIQTGSGNFAITRPGKFYWQVLQPEEEQIVSDGNTLWYFSPFLEQVTILNLQDALEDTPFLLLAQQETTLWQQYAIKKLPQASGAVYSLTPNAQSGATFNIQINAQQQLTGFSVQEKAGALSEFKVSNLVNQGLAESKFHFVIPSGTEIDDQR